MTYVVAWQIIPLKKMSEWRRINKWYHRFISLQKAVDRKWIERCWNQLDEGNYQLWFGFGFRFGQTKKIQEDNLLSTFQTSAKPTLEHTDYLFDLMGPFIQSADIMFCQQHDDRKSDRCSPSINDWVPPASTAAGISYSWSRE